MKLNLEYYKEECDNKKIPEEYEEVLEKVENCETSNFSKTLGNKAKIKNILALSDIRENILNWYNFEKEASILELNAHYGEITGLLCKEAQRVVSIEENRKWKYLNSTYIFSALVKKGVLDWRDGSAVKG